MTFKAVIFDLDGTLVDSAPGILSSMRAALEAMGTIPALPLTNSLIGPPLTQTLQLLCPAADQQELQDLLFAFKQHYDADGYKSSLPFAGVNHMLEALHAAGLPKYIATNKRQIPTRKIVAERSWTEYFEAVYSPDSFLPAAKNKGDMLTHILGVHRLAPSEVVYVGDRADDAQAANQSGVHFLPVPWGYEDQPVWSTDKEKAVRIQDVQAAILAGKGQERA